MDGERTMSINNKTLSEVQSLTTSLTTNEDDFRTGLNDISTQTDNNDERIDDITDGTHTYTGRVSAQAGVGSYTIVSGNTTATVSSGVNIHYHSGTGTVTVPIERTATDDIPGGTVVEIYSEGTLTVNWGTNARGISLGNTAKMARGVFANGRWFYTETLYK